MEDQKKNLEPVVVVADAWHLSRAQAYKDAALIVADMQPDPAMSLDQFASQILERFKVESGTSMKTFMRNSHYGAADGVLRPHSDVTVAFDDSSSLPMVQWPEDPTRGQAIVDLPADEGVDMTMTVPFRPIELSRLQPVLVIKLNDHYHAATAALAEVLRCAHQSARSAFQINDQRAAWDRLLSIITTLRSVARISMRRLVETDYVGWRAPALPSGFEISTSASLICQVASSVQAICAVSTHLMATWLVRLANQTEALPGDEREHAFMQALTQACESVEATLQGLNTSLANANFNEKIPFQTMVIFRPIPQSVPVLLILQDNTDKVAKISRRSKVSKK